MWKWRGYLMPKRSNCFYVLTITGGYWAPVGRYPGQDLAGHLPQAGSAATAGPPPGHPERLVDGRSLSASERHEWAVLAGLEW